MESFITWMKKNGSTVIFGALFILLLVNKDAKAWLLRQLASTGILNSEITAESNTAAHSTPVFIVKNANGFTTDVSQLKGKVVFINFWASWCPPCRAEFPSIVKLYEKYKSNPDMVFLIVNLDDNPALGKAYLEKEKYPLPFFTAETAVPKAFFGGSLPTTVILDKKGEIRLHHEGVADYSKASFYEQVNQLLDL